VCCFLGSVAVIAAGVASVYWLMVGDAHFLLLTAFGAACGGWAGRLAWGEPGVLSLAYLPPDTGIDLEEQRRPIRR
jgi:hypothetical protein